MARAGWPHLLTCILGGTLGPSGGRAVVCPQWGAGTAPLQGGTQLPAGLCSHSQPAASSRKKNIPEFLPSLLIRGCLAEKTFIIPALPSTVLSSLFIHPPHKSSQQLQPNLPCTKTSCPPGDTSSAGRIPSFSCKTPAAHRSCTLSDTPSPPFRGGRGVLGPSEPLHTGPQPSTPGQTHSDP